jgi:hypothetical protein
VLFTGGSGISGVYEYIFAPVLGADGEVEFIAGTTRGRSCRSRTPGGGHRAPRRRRQGGQAAGRARFSQADASNTRPHAGIGLGLAIVKQLVELHGGSVRAKSAGPGHGATFCIELPLPSVANEAAHIPDRRHPSRSERAEHDLPDPASCFADFSGLKILVVDDEADARALMRRPFEDSRATVHGGESVPTPGTRRLSTIRAINQRCRDCD